MTDSPNLGLPYLEASQAQKHVTHNEALRRLDTLVQAAVIDRTLTAPPVSPVDGDSYIPATGATGAWVGHALEIASWQDGAWVFYPPSEGWRVWSSAEDALLAWNGTAWAVTGGAAPINPTPLVGVNTTADTTNRLAVSSPASLFNHAGNGHQQKINKNTAADTASTLYQTGFSGRAEMGLTGDDNFHFKVSADGAAWNEAIEINKATGAVSFPNTSFAIPDADKGDITVTGAGAVWTIDNDVVTNAKLANMATATFKGRTTAGTGDPEDLTIAQVKALLAYLADANTWTAQQIMTLGTAGTTPPIRATNTTDTAATYAIILESDRATPTNNDILLLPFRLSDSAGNQDIFGRIGVTATDVASGSEDATFRFDIMVAGTLTTKLGLSATALYPAANDGLAIGSTTNGWSDLHLALGGNVNWANGDSVLDTTALAERRLPHFTANLGLDCFLQPFLGTQKVIWWSAAGNTANAMTAPGGQTLTATGTLTARNVATTNILTRVRRLGHVSAAGAGSVAGARNAAAQWTVGDGAGLGGFFFSTVFNISDASIVTAGRVFVGLQAATGAPSDVEPSTLVNCLGVGCDSSHTNLHIFYGGSAAQTPVSLGANFPSDTTDTDLYRLCLFSSPDENGIIYYEVTRLNTGHVARGTISGTVGTQVPASTTLITPNCYRSNGGVATAVGIDLSYLYIETEQ